MMFNRWRKRGLYPNPMRSNVPRCQVYEDGPCPWVGHPVQIGDTAGAPAVLYLCRGHARMIGHMIGHTDDGEIRSKEPI